MPEQTELARDPLFPAREIFQQLQVVEVARESILRECFRLGERLPVSSDTAAGEIECQRRQSRLRQPLREMRKERPVRETLEAMTDDDCANRRFREIGVTADTESILARNLELFRHDRLRHCSVGRDNRAQSTTSPPISAQP